MNDPIIRELEEKDLTRGFLTTLDALRETSSMNNDKVLDIFKKIKLNPEHIIVVAEIECKIVGSTTLLIEPKFIHQGGIVGHIEDVAVDKNFQGEKIIKHVLELAKILVFHVEDDQVIQVWSEKKIHYKQDVHTELELKLPMNINLNLETAGEDIDVRDIHSTAGEKQVRAQTQ